MNGKIRNIQTALSNGVSLIDAYRNFGYNSEATYIYNRGKDLIRKIDILIKDIA